MSTEVTKGKTRDEIAQAYSSEPWWYDLRGFFILTFAYNSTLPAQLRFFGNHFGQEHAEIACGTGTLLELLLRWRKFKGLPKVHVTGIDYAESMLAGAKQRFAKNDSVSLLHADAAQLPFKDNTFDTANIANSIHCFPSPDAALKDILRTLKPGGTLRANVLTYPAGIQPLKWFAGKINTWAIKKGILYTPYKPEEVRQKLKAAGYDIVEEFQAGNTFNVTAKKP